jgi:hypothetical protein
VCVCDLSVCVCVHTRVFLDGRWVCEHVQHLVHVCMCNCAMFVWVCMQVHASVVPFILNTPSSLCLLAGCMLPRVHCDAGAAILEHAP